jgi:hypothetical protein
MRREGRRLVVDVERAPTLRAAIGPMAWLVLEALAERCPPRSPSAELEFNTRQLSAALGLYKDSVARALRILASRGLVRRTDHRDPRSGRFQASVYLVDLAAAGLVVEDGEPAYVHEPDARGHTLGVEQAHQPVEPDRWWTQLDLLSDGPTSAS